MISSSIAGPIRDRARELLARGGSFGGGSFGSGLFSRRSLRNGFGWSGFSHGAAAIRDNDFTAAVVRAMSRATTSTTLAPRAAFTPGATLAPSATFAPGTTFAPRTTERTFLFTTACDGRTTNVATVTGHDALAATAAVASQSLLLTAN